MFTEKQKKHIRETRLLLIYLIKKTNKNKK